MSTQTAVDLAKVRTQVIRMLGETAEVSSGGGGGKGSTKTPTLDEFGSNLTQQAADGKLVVLDKAVAETPKTKVLAQVLANLKLSDALFIDGAELNVNFALASRNLPFIDVLPSQGANVYDILRRDTLVLTKAAVERLEARLK